MHRQVHVGGLEKRELLERLVASGVRTNALADELFADDRFTTSPVRTLLDVEQVRVSDLGLPSGGTIDQIVGRAAERGLALCPLELGPHLRLVLTDQPESPTGLERRNRAPDGSITIASAALSADESVPKGFYLLHAGGERWLRGYRSWSGHPWSAEDAFVFVRSPGAGQVGAGVERG